MKTETWERVDFYGSISGIINVSKHGLPWSRWNDKCKTTQGG